MRAFVRWSLKPMVTRSTYRQWTHLILGCVLAIPYVAVAITIGIMLRSGMLGFRVPEILVVAFEVAFVAVTVGATALVPPARRLEASAARELLRTPLPDPGTTQTRSWPARWRTGAWLVAHLGLGSVIGFLTLAVAPLIVVLVLSPLLPRPAYAGNSVSAFFAGAGVWTPLVGIALFFAGFYLVTACGWILTKLAPALLGPTPHERLAAAQREVRALSERNRLASELHDSVGHTLSVVTLQAGAAARVLRTDPAFAQQAISSVEEAARSAMQDLDHVLGLLRGIPGERAGQASLADLDSLIRSTETAGLTVEPEISGTLDDLDDRISGEAYRIVREGLTNALRHGAPGPISLRVATTDTDLLIDVANPLGPATSQDRQSHGLGLAGIRDRVEALGGTVETNSRDDQWRMAVRIPITSVP